MAVLADYSGNATPTAAEWNSYALNGALQYLSEFTFSSTSIAEFDYCFAYPATQFRNFRVVLSDLVCNVASQIVILRMKIGQTATTTGIYAYSSRSIDTTMPTAVLANYQATAGTGFVAGPVTTSASLKSYYVFDICTPQSVFATTVYGRGGQLGVTQSIFSAQTTNTVGYDGFELNSGITVSTITGNVQVYGYRTEL